MNRIGEIELRLQLLQQVDHLGLDRHVKAGNRLVGHDEVRAHGQRAGDADPLALAAAELVGIAVGMAGIEADTRQQRLNLVVDLNRIRDTSGTQGYSQDVAHGLARVQRRVRVLEDDLRQVSSRARIWDCCRCRRSTPGC